MAEAEPREIVIEAPEATTTALVYRAHANAGRNAHRPATIILAHGAGAGQRHPFMTTFARGLSQRGLDVVTFDFLYMHQRRRVPDRMPQLVACYRAVIAAARVHIESARERLVIGGKSMGGRAATHVAADDPALNLCGIVLLGYPLHPPGRLDQLRDAHLPSVKNAMLFVQGSRDTFGTPDELRPVLARLNRGDAATIKMHEVEGGDHSFKVRGRDTSNQAEVFDQIQNAIVAWVAER